jgi:two-component system LytT family response regulator
MTYAKLKTLIVDDEPLAREALRVKLTADEEFEIVGEAGNGKQAIKEIQRLKPDLLFLDVQMPDLDGFQVLAALRRSELPMVTFVTAFEQHAVRGFEVHALDYLLKPFDDDRLQETFTRVKVQWRQDRGSLLESRLRELLDRKREDKKHHDRMIVREKGKISFVRTGEIKWFRAEGNYVKLFLGQNSHMLHTTMNSLQSQLDPARFFRIHRSVIINIDHLQELRPWQTGEYVVIMRDGTELTMSRGYRNQLDELLGAFK